MNVKRSFRRKIAMLIAFTMTISQLSFIAMAVGFNTEGATATPGTTHTDDDQLDSEASSEDSDSDTTPTVGTFGIVPSGIDLFAATPNNYPAKIVADNHTVLLRVDGRLLFFGDNTYGQCGFGPGAPLKIYTPTENTFFADNGLKIKDVYVIEDATFVLCSNGELYAFGKGLNGRLGLGSTSNVNTPTLIPGSQSMRIEKLYTGKEFVIADTGNNEIYGWGRNNYGQVGNGTKVDVTTPTLIMSNADIKYLKTGSDFVMLIKQDNSAEVWGNNDGGRYGFNAGTITPSSTALSMTTCNNPADQKCSYSSTSAHAFATCAGRWTTYTQYTGVKGNDLTVTIKEFTSPQKVITGANKTFNSISTLASSWSPAGTANGVTNTTTYKFTSTAVQSHTHNRSYCSWFMAAGCTYAPASASGATSTGTATWQYVLPYAFAYFDTGKTTELQLGSKHGIANINGLYYGWGDNSLKQLGTSGNDNGYMVPLTQINDYITQLNSGEGFSSLIVAGDTNYIISGTGNVSVFGSNANGKAGINSAVSFIDTPTKINALNGKAVAAIIPGRSHVLYITHTGDVYASGDNFYGQLGLGDDYVDEIKATSPVLIETFKFSEAATRPDAPDGINTPDEVESGTDFEIHWTKVNSASNYEIIRHYTPDTGSGALLLAAATPTEEVVYTGDQTTFTDTVYDEGIVYYTGHAVSNFGDKSVGTTSSDIRVLASTNGDNGSGGNNNNDNSNGNNNGSGGSGVDKDYLDSILEMFKQMTESQQQIFIESLRNNGASDELITAILAASKKNGGTGDVNVSIPASGMDNKDMLAIMAAMNESGAADQVGTPTTNMYNQPTDLSGLAELLSRDLEQTNTTTGVDDLLTRVLTVAVIKWLMPDTAVESTAVQPTAYQTVNSSPSKLILYLVIGIIITMLGFIIVRLIPVVKKEEEG